MKNSRRTSGRKNTRSSCLGKDYKQQKNFKLNLNERLTASFSFKLILLIHIFNFGEAK